MEGLIFPIIMLAVTLLGGGLLLIVLKHSKPKYKGGGENPAIQTPRSSSMSGTFGTDTFTPRTG